MSAFDQFKQLHGPASNKQGAASDVVERYRSILPERLIQFWEQEGWASYANGFLWVTDPTALADVLEDWLEPPAEGLVIARTAMAHLFLWGDEAVYLLNPNKGRVDKLTDNVDILFDTVLCEETVLQGLKKDVYDASVPRLGRPDRDECFGYVPALTLNGKPEAEYLQRVKLREHLGILAQLLGPETGLRQTPVV